MSSSPFRNLEFGVFSGGPCAVLSSFFIVFLPLSRLQTDLSQGAHAREVVSRHRQYEQLVHFLQSTHHHLANRANELGPTKALFDQFALLLRDIRRPMDGLKNPFTRALPGH